MASSPKYRATESRKLSIKMQQQCGLTMDEVNHFFHYKLPSYIHYSEENKLVKLTLSSRMCILHHPKDPFVWHCFFLHAREAAHSVRTWSCHPPIRFIRGSTWFQETSSVGGYCVATGQHACFPLHSFTHSSSSFD